MPNPPDEDYWYCKFCGGKAVGDGYQCPTCYRIQRKEYGGPGEDISASTYVNDYLRGIEDDSLVGESRRVWLDDRSTVVKSSSTGTIEKEDYKERMDIGSGFTTSSSHSKSGPHSLPLGVETDSPPEPRMSDVELLNQIKWFLANGKVESGNRAPPDKAHRPPLTAGELRDELSRKRFDSPERGDAERRLFYISDLDADGARALVETAMDSQNQALQSSLSRFIDHYIRPGVKAFEKEPEEQIEELGTKFKKSRSGRLFEDLRRKVSTQKGNTNARTDKPNDANAPTDNASFSNIPVSNSYSVEIPRPDGPGEEKSPTERAPQPQPVPTQPEPATLDSDVVQCSEPGCEAKCSGEYRHANLRRHFRYRHDDRKFVCSAPHCGRLFHSRDVRLAHERQKHPELNGSPPKRRRIRDDLGSHTSTSVIPTSKEETRQPVSPGQSSDQESIEQRVGRIKNRVEELTGHNFKGERSQGSQENSGLDRFHSIIVMLWPSMTLNQIMTVMEEDYGFQTSKVMYKMKLSQWIQEGRLPPKKPGTFGPGGIDDDDTYLISLYNFSHLPPAPERNLFSKSPNEDQPLLDPSGSWFSDESESSENEDEDDDDDGDSSKNDEPDGSNNDWSRTRRHAICVSRETLTLKDIRAGPSLDQITVGEDSQSPQRNKSSEFPNIDGRFGDINHQNAIWHDDNRMSTKLSEADSEQECPELSPDSNQMRTPEDDPIPDQFSQQIIANPDPPGYSFVSNTPTSKGSNEVEASNWVDWSYTDFERYRVGFDDGSIVSSYANSIISTASLASSATDLSLHSKYSPAQIVQATRALIIILRDDRDLAPLYTCAIEDDTIGSAKLERNLRRLFKHYAEALKEEAGDTLQYQASRLVLVKAREVARSIVTKYDSKPVAALHPSKQTPVVMDVEPDSDEDNEQPTIDENIFNDIALFQEFLLGSVSFATLRASIMSFILPKSVREIVDVSPHPLVELGAVDEPSKSFQQVCKKNQLLTSGFSRAFEFLLVQIFLGALFVVAALRFEPFQQAYAVKWLSQLMWLCACIVIFHAALLFVVEVIARSRTVRLRLGDLGHTHNQPNQANWYEKILCSTVEQIHACLIALQYLEPPLQTGFTRLRWHCKCGDSLYGDVYEYREGGIARMIDRMERSYGTKVVASRNAAQYYSFRAPNWIKGAIQGIRNTLTGSTKKSHCLPKHNKACGIGTQVAAGANQGPQSTLHLMACMQRGRHRRVVDQSRVDSINADRDLFCHLKRRILKSRGLVRRFLSLRCVKGMYFVKFRLRSCNSAEVRDHEPCCTSSAKQVCECIPPASRVAPPNAEYECDPAGPLDTYPPVMSQELMHMLHHPELIDEKETFVLKQLPKRTLGELKGQVGQPVEGWGIHYKEGWDWDVLIGTVFTIFFLGSLAFAVLWTYLKYDIQGAFGVSSYMVTVMGILAACIVNRAGKLG